MSDAVWDQYGSPHTIDQEPGETIRGRAAETAFETELQNGLPDLHGDPDLVVRQDDLVAVRYSASGTHTGEF